MKLEHFCPYYGSSEEACDVGFGYLSPHDVEVIVRHCLSRFEDCGRYAELRDRCAAGGEGETAEIAAPLCESPGERLRRAPGIDRETITAIHHELRTPLTSIRSFAEILLQYPVEDLDGKRRFLKVIHEEAERLNQTVEEWFGNASDPSAPSLPGRARARSDRGQEGDATIDESRST